MSSQSQSTRRLAAIMFADIVGYTAMMQSDEGVAFSRLQRYKDVLDQKVIKHGGEIVKSYGDGSLCIFSSILSAVSCGKEIQEELMGQGVPLRIGIHLGDIMYRSEDVYGDALNIASRIESMGIAGSILVSRDVFKKVKNQTDLSFKSLGRFQLKNVEEPLEIFALTTAGLSVPTREEIKGKVKKIDASHKTTTLKWTSLVLGLLAIFAIYQSGILSSLFGSQSTPPTERGAVAVMHFENNTNNEAFDLIGKMVSNRIIHGITENDIAKVITNETINDYNKIGRATLSPESQNSFLSARFGVREVINGNIYQLGDSLLFDCVLSDAKTEEVIKGIKTIKCAANEPMKGIEELKQTVLGFLAVSKDIQLNLSLETSPPKYEAYQQLMLANEKGMVDDPMEFYHLKKAVELDSNYFEPKVLLLSHYYNRGEYELGDSILQKIHGQLEQSDKRQRNLLNFYDALFKGQNDLIFKYFNNEYELAPFHLASNMTNMVLAVEFINRPDLADPMYEVISNEGLDIANCANCASRMFVKIYMDIQQGRLKSAIDVANELSKAIGPDRGGGLLMRAYVKTNNWKALDEHIAEYKIEDPEVDLLPYYYAAAKECVLENKLLKATEYLSKAKQVFGPESNQGRVGDIYYMDGDIQSVKEVFEKMLDVNPNSLKALSYLAGIYLKENNLKAAGEMIRRINDQRAPYQYGDIDYWLARSYAIGGDQEKALAGLKSAAAQGYRYGFHDFQHDFIFVDIKDLPEFEEILTYWQ